MTIKEIKEGKSPSLTITSFDIVHSSVVQRSVIEPLLQVSHFDENDNVDAVFYHNDVTLLFNQQRLEKVLGKDSLKAFFDSLAPKSDALRSLRSKISDNDLADLCKSRYLQSPSEILAWSNFLNANYSTLLDMAKSKSDAENNASEPIPNDGGNNSTPDPANAPVAS